VCRDVAAECEGMACKDVVSRFPAQMCILALQFAWTMDNEEGLSKVKSDPKP
jgi:hypothetical protein